MDMEKTSSHCSYAYACQLSYSQHQCFKHLKYKLTIFRIFFFVLFFVFYVQGRRKSANEGKKQTTSIMHTLIFIHLLSGQHLMILANIFKYKTKVIQGKQTNPQIEMIIYITPHEHFVISCIMHCTRQIQNRENINGMLQKMKCQ